MNYKCKSCGGSMVYSPKHKTMFCPSCSQTDTEDIAGNKSMNVCPFCGGELNPGEFDSSSQCEYCDNYIVYDERVEGKYKADYIIPFAYDKQDAISEMEKTFKKRIFIPSAFWSEKRLRGMKGYYVPFFLYQYDVAAHYHGTGTKTRSWTSGNYTYTETSYFSLDRELEATYDKVPADASEKMPDDTMDLIEPYDYDRLMEFDPKYLSGFFGEVYNDVAESYESRARVKTINGAYSLLRESLTGYSLTTPLNENNVNLKKNESKYSLFPVWVYDFEWNGKKYPIYVNGQTKKVVGNTPVSKTKVLIYALTHGVLIFGLLEALFNLMGVL